MDGPLYGIIPGIVESYDGDARSCRVSIPGITDGSSVLPEATFNNPLGDRAMDSNSKSRTEIEIKRGDLVNLMFEGGDPRFPVIMGFRTARTGNPVGWRRWHHLNIEMSADEEMVLNATNLRVKLSGNMTVEVGGVSTLKATTHTITADTATIGALTNNDVNVGSTHTHKEQGNGVDVSVPH